MSAIASIMRSRRAGSDERHCRLLLRLIERRRLRPCTGARSMTRAARLPVAYECEAEVRLGLIGDNIAPSRSPALHRLAGELTRLRVSYDLLVPPQLGLSFDEVLSAAHSEGLRGVNVTLPYKERVLARVRVDDPAVARIGAVNTVRFIEGEARGYNTDYSGFMAAFRATFGAVSPGQTVVIGTGGVGKAVAFGLIALGAHEIVLVDQDALKAETLARSLHQAAEGRIRVRVAGLEALASAEGVVNGTPLGMVGYPGSPVPDGAFPPAAWAFDAVYTPTDTPFRAQATAAGARFLSGWELFFHQGVDAFEIFTGRRPDLSVLRAALGDAPPVEG